MNLVLIETSGNQAYIFSTNKLRENVGASELTAQMGTKHVHDAVQHVGGNVPRDPSDPTTYPVLSDGNPVEIILAVSGKALLLVRDASIGREIVRFVTLQALRIAPGLQVYGVVSQDFDFAAESLHDKIGEAHKEFEKIRSRFPGPSIRYQRFPMMAECATSGLPAAIYDHREPDPDPDARSAVTCAKRKAATAGFKRIDQILRKRYDRGVKLPSSIDDFEDLGCDWLAIVHADGNGLGEVFLHFNRTAGVAEKDNRDYINKLRRFSLALEDSTEQAFCEALLHLKPLGADQTLPIIPLVLGGDDLTVICDGRQALRFTERFIHYFEERTRSRPEINHIKSLSNGVTNCAGVAIVKPHFPFSAGYELAEKLLKNAKLLAKRNPQQPVSAIDYHILYDSSGADLNRIRAALTVDDGKTLLVARPYVTSSHSGPKNRHWADLQSRIELVRAEADDESRRQLPNSMLHELREALFLGHKAADARLNLVVQRYLEKGLKGLLADASGVEHSLFWQDGDERRTALLDAVDTADFWEAKS